MSQPLPSAVERPAPPPSPEAPRESLVWEAGRSVPRAAGRSGRMQVGVALALVCLYPVDFLVLGALRPGPLAVRVGWALALMGIAWLSPRLSESGYRSLKTLQAAVSSLFFLTLIHHTGGMASPYFYCIPMMPVLIGMMNPQNSRTIFVSGALNVVGSLVLVLRTGGTLSAAVVWGFIVACSTLLAAYAASQLRRTQAAEAEAREERARREALEQLALSERRRTQSEKLATIGRLATNVVHEINNPLAFIRANVEFLQEQARAGTLSGGPRGEVAELLAEVSVGIERIRQITADLKGFTYMDGEEPTECRLVVAVADAARLASLRLKRVARLRVDVPESLPSVYAVHRRLAQVLLNLLVNAGDALEEARVSGAEVRVTGREEGGRVVLLVEDDGPGFAPEVLPRLFEPFFTTKGPELGTGLGLALSREMVEQFGGSLTAENRAEGGARLRIELPVYTPGPWWAA